MISLLKVGFYIRPYPALRPPAQYLAVFQLSGPISLFCDLCVCVMGLVLAQSRRVEYLQLTWKKCHGINSALLKLGDRGGCGLESFKKGCAWKEMQVLGFTKIGLILINFYIYVSLVFIWKNCFIWQSFRSSLHVLIWFCFRASLHCHWFM